MINYLKQLNITEEQIAKLNNFLHPEILENLSLMQNNVMEVLSFLKEFGVKNIFDIVKFRPDICFKNKDDLIKDLTVFDKELLLFVFNNDIDDLINFNI